MAKYITVAEASERFGVHKVTLYKLAKELGGSRHTKKRGRQRLFSLAYLSERFETSRPQEPESTAPDSGLVDVLKDQLRVKDEQIARLQSGLDESQKGHAEMRRLLARATQRLELLEGRQEPQEAAEVVDHGEVHEQPDEPDRIRDSAPEPARGSTRQGGFWSKALRLIGVPPAA